MNEYIQEIMKYKRFDGLKNFILDFYQKNKSQIVSAYQYPIQGITSKDDINTCKHQKFGGKFTGDETVFDQLLDIFKDTELDHFIKSLDYKVYRSRLFLMPAGHEMSIHRDPTPRIHVPIKTSIGNEFWFWKDTPDWTKIQDADTSNILHKQHMPADGSVYMVDTTRSHTFVNHSSEFRIHLVFVLGK